MSVEESAPRPRQRPKPHQRKCPRQWVVITVVLRQRTSAGRILGPEVPVQGPSVSLARLVEQSHAARPTVLGRRRPRKALCIGRYALPTQHTSVPQRR